jgi:dihydrodipicolinate synthase/N-acetylneuraminate lyase
VAAQRDAFQVINTFHMKTTPVTPDDLARSVLAVPPLARHANLTLNHAANKAQIDHLQAGGVRTLMYGGNANFYNIGTAEYPSLLDMLEKFAAKDTWVIPSIGSDFGKAFDQISILRERNFPTAMALPQAVISTEAGIATGIRKLAERYGKPLIVYIKSDDYLSPKTVAALDADGCVSAVKYGTIRSDYTQDAYGKALVQAINPNKIISGIGERPAIIHLRDLGLQGFTSGSVCVAPRGSMAILKALRAKDYATAAKIRLAYLPMEDARDEINPIRTLHEAVTLAGIADMGPMLPMLSNIEEKHFSRVRDAARALLAHDQNF